MFRFGRCLVLLIGGFLTVSLYAQQFSADMVNLRPDKRSEDNSNHAKLYINNDKVRIESQEQRGGGVVMIWDSTHRYVLMPERRMYMDYAPMMGEKMGFVSFWHPSDINNACPEWHKFVEQMQHKEKWGTCRKIGNDTINGRSAVKYEGTSTEGKTGDVWIDSKLHYITKVEGKDGGMELRNIQEGPQPASLFEVPPGYQKFDMGNMRPPQR